MARRRSDPQKMEVARRRCREYHRKNRDRLLAAGAARQRAKKPFLMKRYGMTLGQYNEMLAAQQNVCAVCNSQETIGRALAVDHCHETGKIRGLLCARCNTTIGRFGDGKDFHIFLQMIDYIRRHKEGTTNAA